MGHAKKLLLARGFHSGNPSGVSGIAGVERQPVGNTSALPSVHQNHGRAATLPSQLLFVPNEDGTIGIYPLNDPSTPVAQITGLQASQQGMVVNASGNLFVVNNGASAGDDYVLNLLLPTRDRRPS